MNSVENLTKTLFRLHPIEETIEIQKQVDLHQFFQFLIKLKSGNSIFNKKIEKVNTIYICDYVDVTLIVLFCLPFILFGGKQTCTKTGFKDLNHINDRTKKHEASGPHIKNSVLLALLGTINIVEQLDRVYRRNIIAHNDQVKQSRYVLSIIINCIHFCGMFELALRGHNESKESNNPEHFRGLIDFSAELDRQNRFGQNKTI